MKSFKKIVLLLLSALLCFALGIVAGCDEPSNNTPAEPSEYVYKIRVQSEGGFGLKNVTVGLYNGQTLVKEKVTSAQGNAFFTESDGVSAGEYEVRLSGVPDGWHQQEGVVYRTTSQENTTLNVSMNAQLITDKEIPASKVYSLGDVMYDFSITTSEYEKLTLSEILEEKEMVLINFWATWCGPCKSEFPAMQNAYLSSKDNVEILALSTTDSQEAVADFKQQQGLSFPMAGGSPLVSRFNTSAVPVSIVVDRYGVISYMHTGAMTASSDFLGLFDKFIGDDYVQTVIGVGEYEGSPDEGGSTDIIKPTVSAPSVTDAKNALTAEDGFTVSWEDDEYSWPWTIEQDGDGAKYLRASNHGVHNSYSIINLDMQVQDGDAIFFDAWISTELNADFLYVLVDGRDIHSISGFKQTWTTYCAYVFNSTEEGKHTLSFCYLKDISGAGGEDEVYIRNLRIGKSSDIGEHKTVASADIFRTAASVYNDPKDIATGETKTQFSYYANVVLNNQDGFYHVGNENGPLLFADLMEPTLWNDYDVWQLAYNDYLIYDGMNLSDVLEDYAWVATNASLRDNTPKLVPVDQQLKDVLDMVARVNVLVGATADEDKHVAYHENEWLEMCVYYEHYGVGNGVQDPTRGITYASAIPLSLGQNIINCDISIVPVGLKHVFVPEKTGIYRFHSTIAKEYEDTAAQYDPMCWILEGWKAGLPTTEITFLAYGDDNILAGANENFENFDIYVHLNAGETYYALFGLFLNSTGKFPIEILYMGETYSVLEHCATGPYSFNEVTMETYVPDALAYEYDETLDVYYYDANGNGAYDEGTNDSFIYLDMVRSSYIFTSTSLQQVIEEAQTKYPDASKRLFYLNGVDYTATMSKYLFKSMLNEGDLYGMVAVNKEIMDILVKLMRKADGFGGIENSWQLMCYYYKTLEVK